MGWHSSNHQLRQCTLSKVVQYAESTLQHCMVCCGMQNIALCPKWGNMLQVCCGFLRYAAVTVQQAVSIGMLYYAEDRSRAKLVQYAVGSHHFSRPLSAPSCFPTFPQLFTIFFFNFFFFFFPIYRSFFECFILPGLCLGHVDFDMWRE